jgi:hypothetical protein
MTNLPPQGLCHRSWEGCCQKAKAPDHLVFMQIAFLRHIGNVPLKVRRLAM